MAGSIEFWERAAQARGLMKWPLFAGQRNDLSDLTAAIGELAAGVGFARSPTQAVRHPIGVGNTRIGMGLGPFQRSRLRQRSWRSLLVAHNGFHGWHVTSGNYSCREKENLS